MGGMGYESESAFGRAFKRYSGCSPRRYAIAGVPEVAHGAAGAGVAR
jgi:AraC-like DNA-binding protein